MAFSSYNPLTLSHMPEKSILDNLDGIESRFEEVSTLITDPAVIADMKRYVHLTREYKDLQKLVALTRRYRQLSDDAAEARSLLETESDADMREMARLQLEQSLAEMPGLEEQIKLQLIPADPEDARNAVLEIRAGTGGDEAAIFAGDLFKMYQRYCESRGWQFAVTSFTEGAAGGFKEVVVAVTGEGVYGILKYESGVHRVQRVPATETQGRIHTSAATVAVMPEVDDVEVEINQNDLRIDTYRAGGAGGQHVNRTDSAVRITHIPTGIVVQCQNERSQIQNREQAMRMLRAKLWDKAVQEQQDEVSAFRKNQVGSGDRSERIRTYNYPQGRVTDHRVNVTLYKLPQVLNGDMDELLDTLVLADQTARLQAEGMN